MFSVFECFLLVLWCDAFVVIVLYYDEPKQNQRTKGKGWSTANWLKPPPPPSNFIAGRPKAALLFRFLGDFRCGVSFFIVIFVIYK